MAKRDPSRKGQRTDIARNEYGLDSRQFVFVLYMLACQGKKPIWSAGKAGYSGDLAKRSRSLLQQPKIQEFLEKYAPPVNRFKVTGDKESLLKRLEQIASAEGIDKTVIAQLKAIELRGKAMGLWEAKSEEGKSRLAEIISVIKAGPVERGSQPCEKCQTMCSPVAKFCSECGSLIDREAVKTPTEKLTAAKKRVGIKESVQ
jgi:phage terminase small subunit